LKFGEFINDNKKDLNAYSEFPNMANLKTIDNNSDDFGEENYNKRCASAGSVDDDVDMIDEPKKKTAKRMKRLITDDEEGKSDNSISNKEIGLSYLLDEPSGESKVHRQYQR